MSLMTLLTNDSLCKRPLTRLGVTLSPMRIPQDAMPISVLVALVNGWGTTPRREAGESGLPLPDGGSIAAGMALALPGEAFEERRLRRLADALYPVFATDEPDLRATQLTSLLSRFDIRPAVVATAGSLEEVWEVSDIEALSAAAVVTLRGQLLEPGPDRLGTCAGARCGDVYVDASPAGHRRFCSLICQNRARVAAFRRRRHAAKSVASQSMKA